MCDTPETPTGAKWQGWSEVPASRSRKVNGDWVDLTYPLSEDVPRSAMFGPPQFPRITEIPTSIINTSRMEMVVHTGTHVDSPLHFCADGPGMDEVPIDRMMGQGVVLCIEADACYEITANDLANASPQIEPGDIVAITTNWGGRWGTKDWTSHPYISEEAAAWLMDKQVKMVAVDTINPDLPHDLRYEGFDFPVHRALLQRGILIAEQVANLEALAGNRVEFFFGALPILACDGAPARVLGRTLVQ